jgi:hypothetical protein
VRAVVCQFDADHVPDPSYLSAVLPLFVNPRIGYVACPSICDANKDVSWAVRGRLYIEAYMHGPLRCSMTGAMPVSVCLFEREAPHKRLRVPWLERCCTCFVYGEECVCACGCSVLCIKAVSFICHAVDGRLASARTTACAQQLLRTSVALALSWMRYV